MPIVFFTIMLDMIGMGIILPYLPFYAVSYEATPVLVGLLVSVFAIAQVISAPVIGKLADAYGRRLVFLSCLSLTVIAYFVLATAESLLIIFLARILNGIGSGKVGVARALVTANDTTKNYTRNLGLISGAHSVGLMLGPIIGGFLAGSAQNPNFQLPAFIAAIMSFLAFILSVFFLKEPQTINAEKSKTVTQTVIETNQQKLIFLLCGYFLANYSYIQILTIFPLWAANVFSWGAPQVGSLFAFSGAIMLVLQLIGLQHLSNLFKEKPLLIMALGLAASGILALAFVSSFIGVILAFFLIATGLAVLNPVLLSLIAQQSQPQNKSKIQGIAFSVAALGRMVGPVVAGWVFAQFALNMPFLSTGILLVMALFFFSITEFRWSYHDSNA